MSMSYRCRLGEEIWGCPICSAVSICFEIWKDEKSRYFSNTLWRFWKWKNMSSLSNLHMKRKKLQEHLINYLIVSQQLSCIHVALIVITSQMQTHKLLHADPQASKQRTEQELSCKRKLSLSSGLNLKYCKEFCVSFPMCCICEQWQGKFKQKKSQP